MDMRRYAVSGWQNKHFFCFWFPWDHMVLWFLKWQVDTFRGNRFPMELLVIPWLPNFGHTTSYNIYLSEYYSWTSYQLYDFGPLYHSIFQIIKLLNPPYSIPLFWVPSCGSTHFQGDQKPAGLPRYSFQGRRSQWHLAGWNCDSALEQSYHQRRLTNT